MVTQSTVPQAVFTPRFDGQTLVLDYKNGERRFVVGRDDRDPNVKAAQTLWPAARVDIAAPPPAGDAEITQWLVRTRASAQCDLA